jgi:hypothetical protein
VQIAVIGPAKRASSGDAALGNLDSAQRTLFRGGIDRKEWLAVLLLKVVVKLDEKLSRLG